MAQCDEKKSVQVLFPCVHGLASGQLVIINCFPAAELKSTIKVVTGVDEEIARRVVGAARYDESDSRAGTGVMVLFSNPLFTGESYGLALAVADKLARYHPIRDWTAIYATGSIPADGCGRVDAVNNFLEKLEMLAEEARPGSLFLYPEKNHLPFSAKIREKLDLLQSKGVECIAVAAVSDLQDKLWMLRKASKPKPARAEVPAKTTRIPKKVWLTAFTLSLVGIVCFLLYFLNNGTDDHLRVLKSIQHMPKSKDSGSYFYIFSTSFYCRSIGKLRNVH